VTPSALSNGASERLRLSPFDPWNWFPCHGLALGHFALEHPALEKRIQSQLRAGKGMLKVAVELGVGRGTVQRIKREMERDRPLESAEAP
jgi:hypothetical protein